MLASVGRGMFVLDIIESLIYVYYLIFLMILFYRKHKSDKYALYKEHISHDYALYIIIFTIFAFKGATRSRTSNCSA